MAKEMVIEQSVVIRKSQKEVYDFLKFARNQDHFSVWNLKDPNRKISSNGSDGQVGFVMTWDSSDKSVGAGAQEIKKLQNDGLIEYEIRFKRPMKNIAQAKFVINPDGNDRTHITWVFQSPTKFPMSLFKGMVQKMLGKDMAQSLENLKRKMEQQ